MITFPSKYLPETHAYLANCTTKPTAVWTVALNTLIQTLIINGVWANLDRMWIFATTAQQNARISIINPTSTLVTEGGTPTWTAKQGYTGNGSSMYLNTNFNPNTQEVRASLNSTAYGIYTRTQPAAATAVEMGARNIATTVYDYLCLNFTAIGKYAKVNDGTASPGVKVADTTKGLVSAVRTTSTAQSIWVNGSSIATSADASVSVIDEAIYVLCYNLGGVAASFSSAQLSMAYFGSSSIDQLKFYNAFQTFMTTLGTQV